MGRLTFKLNDDEFADVLRLDKLIEDAQAEVKSLQMHLRATINRAAPLVRGEVVLSSHGMSAPRRGEEPKRRRWVITEFAPHYRVHHTCHMKIMAKLIKADGTLGNEAELYDVVQTGEVYDAR